MTIKAFFSLSITQKLLNKNERRITWTLFLICMCYFVFVLPITFVHEVDAYIHLGALCIYWLQYSLNFVIYAARIEQYRRAYVLFLRDFGQVISGLIRIKLTRKTVHFSLQDNVVYNIKQNQSQMGKESVSIFKHILNI